MIERSPKLVIATNNKTSNKKLLRGKYNTSVQSVGFPTALSVDLFPPEEKCYFSYFLTQSHLFPKK